MLAPEIVLAEVHEDTSDDAPTLHGSRSSQLWAAAARRLSRLFLDRARSAEVYDPGPTEDCYRLAKELLQLAQVIDSLPGVEPETGAAIRRRSVDRVVRLYQLHALIAPRAAA